MDNSLIFAIDFDGTIVEDKFPEIGRLKFSSIYVMKRLQAADHKVILWTCRTNTAYRDYLVEACVFLNHNAFKPDAINHNIDRMEPFGQPKVIADFYLDDKGFPPFMGWLDFEVLMEEMGIL